jgi:hypothetical protein
VVIWIHGGGWRFGDRRLTPNLALFAQRSGIAVVSIDYRLSDEVKFPAPVEDVKRLCAGFGSLHPVSNSMIATSVNGDHPRVRTWLRVQHYRVKTSFSARTLVFFLGRAGYR